jgi:transaldolase/glucose-6-phosphate isomerase
VTCADQAVPGQKFTFGVVKAAQAGGNFQIPADRKRRALRVRLHDVEGGLAALQTAIAKALS